MADNGSGNTEVFIYEVTDLKSKTGQTLKKLDEIENELNGIERELKQIAIENVKVRSSLEKIVLEFQQQFSLLSTEIKQNREKIHKLSRERDYFSRLVLTAVFVAVISLVVVKTKLIGR